MFPGFLGFSAPVSVTPALAVPATVVEYIAPAPAVSYAAPESLFGRLRDQSKLTIKLLWTARNPDGEPYPAFANDKSWDETSGKAGSGKKFCHSVILGTDSTAQPSIAAIITPVIHLCVTVWKLMKIWQTWDQIRSQFQSLYTADELLKAFTGTTDWVANLFWIA